MFVVQSQYLSALKDESLYANAVVHVFLQFQLDFQVPVDEGVGKKGLN